MVEALLLENENYVHDLARNMCLQQEYEHVLDAFANADIPVISLKGIALIQNIYKDPGTRHIGDIDLLVKPEDYDKARTVLKSLEYTTPPAYFDPMRHGSTSLRSFPFTKNTEIKYYIHLHWHLLNSALPLFMFSVDMDEVWKEAQWTKAGNKDILMLAPHHEVVFLAIHAFKHSYNKMSLFYDLKYMIEYYEDGLNWDRVFNCAEKWNAVIPLYCSLQLIGLTLEGTHFLSFALGTHTFGDTHKRCMSPKVCVPKCVSQCDVLIEKVITRVREDRLATDNLVLPLMLYMTGGLFNKLKYLFISIFPPPRQLSQMYGVRLSLRVFIFYFTRLLNYS